MLMYQLTRGFLNVLYCMPINSECVWHESDINASILFECLYYIPKSYYFIQTKESEIKVIKLTRIVFTVFIKLHYGSHLITISAIQEDKCRIQNARLSIYVTHL